METPQSVNLLESVDPRDVFTDPFPHVIVRNAIPQELFEELTSAYPPDNVIMAGSPGSPTGSNKRFNIYAGDVADSPAIAPVWKAFIREHSSQRYLQHLFRIFGASVRAHYPFLERCPGEGFDHIRPGLRFRDDPEDHDILLDAGISINSPVTTLPTSVRLAHLDLPNKLFVGLFYLRPPSDRQTRGGNLVLCRYRPGVRRRFFNFDVEPDCVEDVRTIPYESNVLVVFLNTIDSLHRVTPRERTRHSRRFVNLVSELNAPLFDGSEYQTSPWSFKMRQYARQLFAWRSVT